MLKEYENLMDRHNGYIEVILPTEWAGERRQEIGKIGIAPISQIDKIFEKYKNINFKSRGSQFGEIVLTLNNELTEQMAAEKYMQKTEYTYPPIWAKELPVLGWGYSPGS